MAIADENALSETAFFVRDGSGYHLRWFTPTLEAAMCGHGTLATAALILERMEPEAPEVAFSTLSGELIVRRSAEDASLLSLDFPAMAVWRGCRTALRPRRGHWCCANRVLSHPAMPGDEALDARRALLSLRVRFGGRHQRSITRLWTDDSGGGECARDRKERSAGRRLCLSLLRAVLRDTRGPGNGLGAHDARAILGVAAQQAAHGGKAAVWTRRRAHGRARTGGKRPGYHQRKDGVLFGGEYFRAAGEAVAEL